MLFLECLKQPFFLSPPLRKRMAFTECMEIREMLLHLFICEEQELREKWSNQNQNHPLYERMCQVASTGSASSFTRGVPVNPMSTRADRRTRSSAWRCPLSPC